MNLLRTLFGIALAMQLQAEDRLYELRVYHTEPGRRAEVNKIVAGPGMKFMDKHDIKLELAAEPIDAQDPRVFLVASHKDRASANANTSAMQTDKEWLDQVAKMTKGNLPIKKYDRFFMRATDYSPMLKPEKVGNRIFELRTYISSPNNLKHLNDRFKNHTLKLFEKYGMTNLVYWNLDQSDQNSVQTTLRGLAKPNEDSCGVSGDENAAGNTLVYLLAHKDVEAMNQSFNGFRMDPAWTKARTDSEKLAGGSLTADKGVKSLLLVPTEYSPIK